MTKFGTVFPSLSLVSTLPVNCFDVDVAFFNQNNALHQGVDAKLQDAKQSRRKVLKRLNSHDILSLNIDRLPNFDRNKWHRITV